MKIIIIVLIIIIIREKYTQAASMPSVATAHWLINLNGQTIGHEVLQTPSRRPLTVLLRRSCVSLQVQSWSQSEAPSKHSHLHYYSSIREPRPVSCSLQIAILWCLIQSNSSHPKWLLFTSNPPTTTTIIRLKKKNLHHWVRTNGTTCSADPLD